MMTKFLVLAIFMQVDLNNFLARVYLCPTHFKQEDITDVLEWSVIVKPQALPIPLIDWNSLHPAAADYLRGQK